MVPKKLNGTDADGRGRARTDGRGQTWMGGRGRASADGRTWTDAFCLLFCCTVLLLSWFAAVLRFSCVAFVCCTIFCTVLLFCFAALLCALLCNLLFPAPAAGPNFLWHLRRAQIFSRACGGLKISPAPAAGQDIIWRLRRAKSAAGRAYKLLFGVLAPV